MPSDYVVYAVGFVAQAFFSARALVQWISSERARRVLAPALFWRLSLLGSVAFAVYGILRDDPVILAGQLLSYGVYARNLHLQGAWDAAPNFWRAALISLPVAVATWLTFGPIHAYADLAHNRDITAAMLTWGGVGQAVYTSRFAYQWYRSERAGASVLTPGFWYICLAGAACLIVYAIYRADPVLFLGYAFGSVVAVRNLVLGSADAPEPVRPG